VFDMIISERRRREPLTENPRCKRQEKHAKRVKRLFEAGIVIKLRSSEMFQSRNVAMKAKFGVEFQFERATTIKSGKISSKINVSRPKCQITRERERERTSERAGRRRRRRRRKRKEEEGGRGRRKRRRYLKLFDRNNKHRYRSIESISNQ
jgi:hypothetical protein